MATPLFRSSWTSIVFEGRNKLYGAFELREAYDQHMVLAIVFPLLSVGCVALGMCLASSPCPISDLAPLLTGKETEVEFKQAPPLFTVPKTPKILPGNQEKAAPSITPNPSTESIKTSSSSVPTEVGSTTSLEPSGGDALGQVQSESGGEIVPAVATELETSTEVGRFAEVMPQFKGNLQSYIAQHFSYPELATRYGVEGKMVVELLLDENGKVSKAKILRSLGYGCDEEALRVLLAMPDWEPARAGGRAVKIKISVPISLRLSK
jgi:protein TonB